MGSCAAMKCSTILAKIRVVFATRGALLVVEDGGSTIRQQALLLRTSRKHSEDLDMKCHFRLFFLQYVAKWEIPRLFDDREFLGTSAGVLSGNYQGISCRFLRTVLLTCFLSTCPLKCSNMSQRLFFLKL